MERWSRAALVALVCLACACGKNEEPARPAPALPMPAKKSTATVQAPLPFKVPEGFDQWPPEKQQRHLKFQADFAATLAENPENIRLLEKAFDDRVKAADEKEMIRPAPPGFKPAPVARRTRLTLIPKTKILKPGERFWYRLELQNLGQETLSFHTDPSFWKIGNMEFNRWKIYLTSPGGKEESMMVQYYDFSVIGPGARGQMSKAQLEDDDYRSVRSSGLYVDLRPGETLVSRPWRRLTGIEMSARYYRGIKPAQVQGEFRELALESRKAFTKPGTYRLRVVFQDYVPEPPTEKEIQESMKGRGYGRQEAEESEMRYYKSVLKYSLGRFESNTVTIAVQP